MRVEPLTGFLGARLTELDLRGGDLTRTVSAVKAAVHQHGVVFCPGQRLTDEEHLAVAQALGQPAVFPAAKLFGNNTSLERLINDESFPPAADHWHTDVTWYHEPPRYGMLSAVEIPPVGGDTLWSDTAAAYDALTPVMQRVVNGLDAHHHIGHDFIAKATMNRGESAGKMLKDAFFEGVHHPLVCEVPETGRRAVFIARYFTTGIVGMTAAESAPLLEFLFGHCTATRFQVRWKWSVDDLVIWDERRTMHFAMGDYFPHRREMRRCTVNDGKVPTRPT